jgi:hypothetical protein
MRLLIIVPHYFNPDPAGNSLYGSCLPDPVSRIAGLNAAIVGLHRYFGPNHYGLNGRRLEGHEPSVLDIVIVTVQGKNVLEWIGITPQHYEVVHFGGDPMMLGFEVHRIMRERAGAYDYYGYMEDDLIIDDPAFFHKLSWFQSCFGPRTLLQPVRYEMSESATLAKIAIDRDIAEEQLLPFRRAGQQTSLSGEYGGMTQTFRIAPNPHSGCHFVSEEQLRLWISLPTFYDRQVAWRGPIESSNTLTAGKVFDMYKPATPNPWFLSIQHAGVRFASLQGGAGTTYGESPILGYSQKGFWAHLHDGQGVEPRFKSSSTLSSEVRNLRIQLESLRTSRRELAKHFVCAILRRPPPRIATFGATQE